MLARTGNVTVTLGQRMLTAPATPIGTITIISFCLFPRRTFRAAVCARGRDNANSDFPNFNANSNAAERPALLQCWKCGKHLCTPKATCSVSGVPLTVEASRNSNNNETESNTSNGEKSAGCGAVQPLLPWTTFLDVFGVSISSANTKIKAAGAFAIDVPTLRQKFLKLQQIVHPDANTMRSEKEREFSDKQSVFINKAYQALRDPLSRAKYILHLNNVHIDEDSSSKNTGMSPGDLMKIMDIWEAIEEVEDQEGLDLLMKENEDRIASEINTLGKIFEGADGTLDQARE
ncbi:hypothetical protein HK100_011977, partial [Physocladia obscura]